MLDGEDIMFLTDHVYFDMMSVIKLVEYTSINETVTFRTRRVQYLLRPTTL